MKRRQSLDIHSQAFCFAKKIKAMQLVNQDELYKSIGKVSSYFNTLEMEISTLIWLLIGSGQTIGEIVTSDLSFRNLLTLLRALYKSKSSENLNKIDEIARRAFNAEEKRNQIIHSQWAVSIKNNRELMRIKTTAKNKRGLKHTYEKSKIDELNKISDEIFFVGEEIVDLIIEELNIQKRTKGEHVTLERVFASEKINCFWIDHSENEIYSYQNIENSKVINRKNKSIRYKLKEMNNKDDDFEIIIRQENDQYYLKSDCFDNPQEEFFLKIFTSSNELICFYEARNENAYFHIK